MPPRALTATLAALTLAALAAGPVAAKGAKSKAPRHNLIIFVADGLRSGIVTPETAPNMAELRAKGVDFHNSHSLFPTVTTANASAIATGHRLGDTGDFGNTIYVGPPLDPGTGSQVAGLEDDPTLGRMNARFAGNYLNETTLLAAARRAGYSTAAIGKLGPTAVQDVTARDGVASIIIDDETGHSRGLPLAPDVAAAIRAAGLDPVTPSRGLNAGSGDFRTPGVTHANIVQQDWYAAVATQVLLPRFKARKKPFVLVFWSRDPDGSQHDQGDSLNSLKPGINGPTAMAGIRNADTDLGRLRARLKELGLDKTTDVVVTADHGFSVIARQDSGSAAAKLSYPDVVPGFAPQGFVAIDLAQSLGLPLYDQRGRPLDPLKGEHPNNGTAVIGSDPAHPDVVIGANGGAELIWLPRNDGREALSKRMVRFLAAQDYVAAIFVDDSLGSIPGTLPLTAVGLKGSARTPRPTIVVSLRSFSTGCENAELCTAEFSETSLQQGQGNHGSLSRANSHNFMAAIGPDFRSRYRDPAPVSNADLAITLAKILKLDLKPQGKLSGRVLAEARKGGGKPAASKAKVLKSKPAANGFVTVLRYQELGKQRYLDSAGASGRVVTGPNG
ncbi:MAG: alkaline phosphatase family protein [Proteobacteria bacterium]|nr:alkaline phosphatase family protein [Pseudomonadota bacterium]